ncbi:MAG: ABC transporter permease [Eubacteriales bacterium]|nr:ABC transporter permease [Eubacteriales bacterium]
MAETMEKTARRDIAVRYHGRKGQILIYLGKFLRMFIYQSDWKVLPMAAFVAGLVGMVTNAGMFQTMEGTLMGAFALVMVCIWNGCFNSIQVICRERDVIKREHRSGMHISSYIIAHMIYQAVLCLLQTCVTLYVLQVVDMRFDLCKPLFTKWFLVDFGISVFLITFAADMMALWISTLARSTTAAMTVIPFVLIFQLVFSGGMLTLPDFSRPLMSLTISAPGMNAVAAQSDYNNRPMVALWNKVQAMGNMEISGSIDMGQVLDFVNKNTDQAQEIRDQKVSVSVTMGQVLDFLHDDTNPAAKSIRDVELAGTINMYQALMMLDSTKLSVSDPSDDGLSDATLLGPLVEALRKDPESVETLSQTEFKGKTTVGDLIDTAMEYGLLDQYRDREVTITRTVGQLIDMMTTGPNAETVRSKSFLIKMTVAELQAKLGVERVRALLQEKAAEGSIKPEYEYTKENVEQYWLRLLLFIVVFASLATITLEFIDKDKR